jgi:solute:Na+ symporter, SSS family
LAGAGTYIYMVLFVHAKEAGIFGLCKLLFNKTTLSSAPWTYIDPMVVALPVSILVIVVVSLLSKTEPFVFNTAKGAFK